MLLLDSIRISTLAVPVLIVVGVLLAVQQYFTVPKDSREPPFITSRLPGIGHILGLIRNGSDYYHSLDLYYRQKVYTLPILRGRMYIVTSPDWAIAVQRAHKTVQFNTIIAQAINKLFLFDAQTQDIINYNLNGENGTRDGIILEIHDMIQTTLAPGPHLDDINKAILNNVAADINNLARDKPQQIKLWAWLRHHFSIASTSALWGPNNPFASTPGVEEAFWEFEANAIALSFTPYPQIFARKSHLARQKVLDAFAQYMEAEHYKDPGVSQLIQNRAEINLVQYGLTKKMHGYGDASMVFGAIVNTVPMAFWLISFIFEDADLLSSIRAEIDKCISTSSSDSKKRTMNTTMLRANCPLLSSTCRENLRLTAAINSNRYVGSDTTITNHVTGESYLLKKDSVVQIASNVIHTRDFWGEDADTFNARRFMPPSSADKAKSEGMEQKAPDPAAPFRDQRGKLHSSAFRSFGGGNNICPGRYFAQVEILGLASLFIAGFEMVSLRGGKYRKPEFESYRMSVASVKPKNDVEVVLRRREGFEGVEWGFVS